MPTLIGEQRGRDNEQPLGYAKNRRLHTSLFFAHDQFFLLTFFQISDVSKALRNPYHYLYVNNFYWTIISTQFYNWSLYDRKTKVSRHERAFRILRIIKRLECVSRNKKKDIHTRGFTVYRTHSEISGDSTKLSSHYRKLSPSFDQLRVRAWRSLANMQTISLHQTSSSTLRRAAR